MYTHRSLDPKVEKLCEYFFMAKKSHQKFITGEDEQSKPAASRTF